MSKSRYILVQDPWHDYAARFIRQFHQKYGYRTICFFSDRREFVRQAPAYPILQSDSVAAIYDVSSTSIVQFAAQLRDHYDIAAVIPFNEPAVSTASALAEHLGLSWSQPQVLRRFRDKFLLKQHLRSQDTTLRINATRQVDNAADIAAARAMPEFARFVLKPNDGFGNRNIGIFDANSDSAEINQYLSRTPGPLLMEEYIDGTEYFINGQIDAAGNVVVIAIFEYERITANGRTNIDSSTIRLPHTDPLFAKLDAYAQQVLRTSGLRRSPFHLELKVDASGPCLIEVAARLPGLNNAFLSSTLLGPLFDWFDVAAHYYLTDADYGPLTLDWHTYDSAAVRYVHGIAAQTDRIHQLQGIDQTESLPEFVGWVKQPKTGDVIKPTVDCLSMPWSVIIKADTEAQARSAETQVRQLIAWNQPLPMLERLRAMLLMIARRYVVAITVRVRYALLPFNRKLTILNGQTSLPARNNILQRMTSRYINAIVRRYQLASFGKRKLQLSIDTAPEFAGVASEAVSWAEEHLAKPHPELGRKGPICPFVKHTVDIGRYFVSVQAAIDGSDIHSLRRVVLDQSAAFLQHSPNVGSKGAFGSLVLVFPNIPDARLGILDDIHSELKTALMERDLMFSPFHKHSSKPSISNPEFKVFRAPFAALVVRHLDVRDIAFLNTNRKAFLHFHSRYAPLFRQGKVSDEFGYVRMYDEACARYGVS